MKHRRKKMSRLQAKYFGGGKRGRKKHASKGGGHPRRRRRHGLGALPSFSRGKRSSVGTPDFTGVMIGALIGVVATFGLKYLAGWITRAAKLNPKFNELPKIFLALTPVGVAYMIKKYKPELTSASIVLLAGVLYDIVIKRLPLPLQATLGGFGAEDDGSDPGLTLTGDAVFPRRMVSGMDGTLSGDASLPLPMLAAA